mgnify:CR=1 FL=1
MKSPYVDQPDSYHFEFLMGMGEIMAISKKYLTVCLLFFYTNQNQMNNIKLQSTHFLGDKYSVMYDSSSD